MELADRAAVITGGSRGLGRAIAARFVEEGASVLLVARDPGPLEQARAELAAHAVRSGQSVHALAGDVALPGTADAVAALAGKELPDLAVLVNNAGVYGPFGAVDEVPWDAWEHAVRVNLFGPVLLCPRARPRVAASRPREDRECLGRRRDVAAPADQRVRGLQGRPGPAHRDLRR